MTGDPEEIRDRAWVERRRRPDRDFEEPMWVAEDPVTDCVGIGHVEAEAVGNLVSVIAERERSGDADRSLLKLPGRVVDRPAAPTERAPSLFDRILSWF